MARDPNKGKGPMEEEETPRKGKCPMKMKEEETPREGKGPMKMKEEETPREGKGPAIGDEDDSDEGSSMATVGSLMEPRVLIVGEDLKNINPKNLKKYKDFTNAILNSAGIQEQLRISDGEFLFGKKKPLTKRNRRVRRFQKEPESETESTVRSVQPRRHSVSPNPISTTRDSVSPNPISTTRGGEGNWSGRLRSHSVSPNRSRESRGRSPGGGRGRGGDGGDESGGRRSLSLGGNRVGGSRGGDADNENAAATACRLGKKQLVIVDDKYFQRVSKALIMRLQEHEGGLSQSDLIKWYIDQQNAGNNYNSIEEAKAEVNKVTSIIERLIQEGYLTVADDVRQDVPRNDRILVVTGANESERAANESERVVTGTANQRERRPPKRRRAQSRDQSAYHACHISGLRSGSATREEAKEREAKEREDCENEAKGREMSQPQSETETVDVEGEAKGREDVESEAKGREDVESKATSAPHGGFGGINEGGEEPEEGGEESAKAALLFDMARLALVNAGVSVLLQFLPTLGDPISKTTLIDETKKAVEILLKVDVEEWIAQSPDITKFLRTKFFSTLSSEFVEKTGGNFELGKNAIGEVQQIYIRGRNEASAFKIQKLDNTRG